MCFLKVEKVHVSSNYKFNVHKYCNTKSFFKQNSELQEKLPENRPAPHKINAPKNVIFLGRDPIEISGQFPHHRERLYT